MIPRAFEQVQTAKITRHTLGEVAERLNAPVSKTGMGYQSIGGSNPPLSAL